MYGFLLDHHKFKHLDIDNFRLLRLRNPKKKERQLGHFRHFIMAALSSDVRNAKKWISLIYGK